MIEAPDTGLVLDVSKRDQKIILWKRPNKGEPRKDNQLFKVNIIENINYTQDSIDLARWHHQKQGR